MTMTSIRSWIAATLTAASLGLVGASTALAQDKPQDEGLERLLEKLEAKDKDKDKDKPAAEKPKDKESSPAEKAKDKPAGPAAPADKPKTPAPVAPKDQELDKLLEGLGQTKETPAADDKKPGGAGSDEPKPPTPKDGQAKPDPLKGEEKDLDQELERITGKKQKPKNQRERKSEEETGPLGEVIKEMRDVEERLGQPDTGEETRKKQTEIVKNLDQLIEQMKNAPTSAQAMKMIRAGKKPGEQGPRGEQPGAMAAGAPQTKADKPKQPPIPDDLAKKIWGELPAQLRGEMNNVMNEHFLPTKADLIKLYYLSLGNKNSNRED
jgi:hypothetical protein